MRLLITGGTGSLGHALTRYVLEHTDWRVVVLSRDELKQARMRETIPDPRLDFRLGDVRDVGRLKLAFHGVDMVVHAAALKRVDAVAGEPAEVFHTNIFGTRNVLEAAIGCRVGRVLLVSTDKACYPTNAYGVSKLAAEHLTVSYNTYGVPQGTRSAVVRYGNVVGSRGSVVHVWRGQDTLTLTDPRMTRFLITMPDATRLVRACLDAMQGGETFVPRLPAARVLHLAEAVKPEAPRVVTGVRPGGEKLHETLLTEEEAGRSVDLGPYLTCVRPHLSPWRKDPLYETEPRTRDGERTSDKAPQLSVEQLREMLATVPEEGV